jgi:PPOX class probable F420-dependent enzyme
MASVDDARKFISKNHRAVLATRREDGRLQTSPVSVGVDGEGRVMISTTSRSTKAKNLQRDPWATVTVITDDFFGPWIQVEGHAEVIGLPEAVELLVDYYRRVGGEHSNWDEYRKAMTKEGRVLIRFPIEGAMGQMG